MIMRRTTSVLAVGTVLLLFATAVRFAKAQDAPADFSDYFETKVRPILVNNYLKSEPMKEYDEYKNQKAATSNPTNEIKPTNINQPLIQRRPAMRYLLALNLSRLLMRPVYLPICRPLQTSSKQFMVNPTESS